MKLVELFFGNIVYFISLFVPKRKNVWIFGSKGGDSYSDNPKYVFEYINKNQPEIKTVWLTKNKIVLEHLRTIGVRVYYINSIKGIIWQMMAKVAIISHGISDINKYACGRLKIVECWHGVPMKPVLLSDPKEEALKKRENIRRLSFVLPYLRKRINYKEYFVICGSGDRSNKILKKVFGDNSNLISSGFPRLDGLFVENNYSISICREVDELKSQGKQIGIYMPTYRREGEFDIVDYFYKNIKEINNHLQRNNQSLFVKIHSFEKNLKEKKNIGNVFFISNSEIKDDIYSILNKFDFLITDYSSIVFDFLILSRPVFFLTPDRESYIKSNGNFVFDYLDLNFDVFLTWDDFFSEVNFEKELSHSNKYKEAGMKFHAYIDGNNSERVVEYINSNL